MQISQESLDQLFLSARTANGFTDRPVEAALLRQVYDIAKMGPTSMNTQPTRYLFLTSPAARERMVPAQTPGNVDKARSAPVTVIVATDTRFYEYNPQIWHRPGAKENFESNPALATTTANRNGTLGGAYFIIAARALGLACGPMSAVDLVRVNAEFFPDSQALERGDLTLGFGTARLTLPSGTFALSVGGAVASFLPSFLDDVPADASNTIGPGPCAGINAIA